MTSLATSRMEDNEGNRAIAAWQIDNITAFDLMDAEEEAADAHIDLETLDEPGAEDTANELNGWDCKPCGKSFTEKRSLTRHLNENKRHQEDDLHSGRRYKCILCSKTCARPFDLRRHEREQHPSISTIYRSASGKDTRIDICPPRSWDHSFPPAGWTPTLLQFAEAWDYNNSSHGLSTNDDERFANYFPDRPLYDDSSLVGSDIRRVMFPFLDLAEAAIDQAGSNEAAFVRNLLETRVEDRRDNDSHIPCGYCHKPFPLKLESLMEHLSRHRVELTQTYSCVHCCIRFVRKEDFIHHSEAAATDVDCGFAFAHANPCTGHHAREREDHKRFRDCLGNWELSQLMVYGRSVDRLVEWRQSRFSQAKRGPTEKLFFKQNDDSHTVVTAPALLRGMDCTGVGSEEGSVWTVPTHVDYKAKMTDRPGSNIFNEVPKPVRRTPVMKAALDSVFSLWDGDSDDPHPDLKPPYATDLDLSFNTDLDTALANHLESATALLETV